MRRVLYPPESWVWNGMVGHFICGQWCRFHLATEVGPWLISTVGLYVHPSKSGGREDIESKYLSENPFGAEIGAGRRFETMVFRAGKKCNNGVCDCGLTLPDNMTELDFAGYNTPGAANAGHYVMCEKWSRLSEVPK